jgi:hypothetical protein
MAFLLFPTTGFQIITENFQLKIYQKLNWSFSNQRTLYGLASQ